ncbi:MAG: hypothetical protein ACJAZV_002012, partial [Roseivirga sp.]
AASHYGRLCTQQFRKGILYLSLQRMCILLDLPTVVIGSFIADVEEVAQLFLRS